MELKGKILVIDDEDSVRESLATILKQMGYHVETRGDGKSAIRLFKQEKFDLVITDLKMAGLSGIEVLEKVKMLQPEILVIIMTGFASLESAIASIRKGAFDYLVKPFQVDALKLVVKRSMEMKRLAENNVMLLGDLKAKNEELARANIEIKRAQKKLVEAERLGAITETVAALHHEINNPLMAMLVKVQVMEDRIRESDSHIGQDLKLLEELILRVASIIEKLRKITKPCTKDYVEEVHMLDIDQSTE